MTHSLLAARTHPGARPVLLIHGFASNGRNDFENTGLVDALAAAGRGAIVVDLPGHGDGPALTRGGATTSDLARALADTIAASGQDVADVIGYSLGARLAWALAGTGAVRRLVLGGLGAMDPFAGMDVDALAAVAAGSAAPADPMQGMFAQIITSPGLDTPSVLALIEGLGAEPFDPAAGAPTVPTLFVSGTEDQMSHGIEALVAAIPGATLDRVPGDHFAALGSPAFREAAVAFVTED